MALPVVLKSGKNYMTLVLDDSLSFEELLGHVVNKFIETQDFFGDQSFALMFDGRKLSEREQLIILDAVSAYTTINISRIVENDVYKEYAVEKSLYDKDIPVSGDRENNCIYIERDIEAGEKISAPYNLVVYGDVMQGAIVKAGANIIIIGGLYGQAIAGDNPKVLNAFIRANDFAPENYRIGHILGKTNKKKRGFGKNRIKPVEARFLDGEIQIESI